MADTQDANDKIELLRDLRQTRFYEQRPVPDDVLNNMLEVARWSGSAGNSQPWEFLVVRDRQKLAQLASLAPNTRWLAGAPAGLLLLLHENVYKDDSVLAFDEGRLTERVMLAAAAQGLGAGLCWYSGDAEAQAKQMLGIPADRKLRTLVGFGYPGAEPPMPPGMNVAGKGRPPVGRKPMSELLHNEQF